MWSAIIASSRVRESYSPELKAIINRANSEGFTLPSKPTLQAADVLIQQMIADGYWQKRDLILNYAYNDDDVENFTRINWKNPTGTLSDYVRDNTLNYNLFAHTENFQDGYWRKINSTMLNNQTQAPDGSMTGCLYTANGANSRIDRNLTTIANAFPLNYSIYVKADSLSTVRFDNGTSDYILIVNLTDGSITTQTGNLSNVVVQDALNGWWRISFTITALVTTSFLAVRTNFEAGTLFIWGIQLTQGNNVLPYLANLGGKNNNVFYTKYGIIGGDAVTSFIDTNFNYLNDSQQYTLNDASRESVITVAGLNNAIIEGTSAVSPEFIRNGNFNTHRINSGNLNLNSVFSFGGDGYTAINRLSSTDVTLIKKDIVGNRTQNSTILQNLNIWLLSNSSISSNSGIGYYSAGASTVTEGQNFRTAYNTYLTSIGLSPIA
jgi:hypothetical protein